MMAVSAAIMAANGVQVDEVRVVDHDLAPGVAPDMTRHGAARDDWPALYQRVREWNPVGTWRVPRATRSAGAAGDEDEP